MHIVYIRLRFVLLLSLSLLLLLLLLLVRHAVDPKNSGSCHVADVTRQTAKLTMRWAIRNNNENNENNDNNLDATIVPIQKSVIMCVWFTRIDNQTTTTTMTTTPTTTSTHRQQLQSGTHHANCCCCSRCDSDRSQSARGRISNKYRNKVR